MCKRSFVGTEIDMPLLFQYQFFLITQQPNYALQDSVVSNRCPSGHLKLSLQLGALSNLYYQLLCNH